MRGTLASLSPAAAAAHSGCLGDASGPTAARIDSREARNGGAALAASTAAMRGTLASESRGYGSLRSECLRASAGAAGQGSCPAGGRPPGRGWCTECVDARSGC